MCPATAKHLELYANLGACTLHYERGYINPGSNGMAYRTNTRKTTKHRETILRFQQYLAVLQLRSPRVSPGEWHSYPDRSTPPYRYTTTLTHKYQHQAPQCTCKVPKRVTHRGWFLLLLTKGTAQCSPPACRICSGSLSGLGVRRGKCCPYCSSAFEIFASLSGPPIISHTPSR